MSDSDNHGPYKGKGETVDVVDDRLESTSEDTSNESDEPKYKDKQWLYHQYHVLKKPSEGDCNGMWCVEGNHWQMDG